MKMKSHSNSFMTLYIDLSEIMGQSVAGLWPANAIVFSISDPVSRCTLVSCSY